VSSSSKAPESGNTGGKRGTTQSLKGEKRGRKVKRKRKRKRKEEKGRERKRMEEKGREWKRKEEKGRDRKRKKEKGRERKREEERKTIIVHVYVTFFCVFPFLLFHRLFQSGEEVVVFFRRLLVLHTLKERHERERERRERERKKQIDILLMWPVCIQRERRGC
jgi:hypothetical protein